MRPRAPLAKSTSALTKSSDGRREDLRGGAGGDAHRLTGERDEHVAEMDAERGPGAGRRVPGIAPPVRRVHFAEIAVADIGVHVQQAAEAACLEQAPHLLHGRFVAAFMPDAEHAAGLGAGGQDSFGAGGVEGERLFAEHLLAGGKAGDRHFLMQQMRRHHRNRIDIGALEQVPVVGDEVEAVRRRKGRDRVVIDVATGHHLEAWTLGQTRDDLLAPPAEPDNADPDHVASFLCFAGPDNVGSRANVQWFAATSLPRPITAPMRAHTRGALISVKKAL